jgi:Transglutaminase-like superfamily
MKRGPQPTQADQRLSMVGRAVLVGEVLWIYSRARLLLWRRDLPSVVLALGATASVPAPSSSDPSPLRLGARLGRVTSRCLRLLPTDSRCLLRSLVLMALLARRGVTSSLVIGVKTGGQFEAHAWIEREGRPLLPAGGGAYARLLELEGGNRPSDR